MPPHDTHSRRDFIGATAAVGAGALLAAGQGVAQDQTPKKRVVYRRLGRTDFMTSHVVAAWDWNEFLYGEAVDAGVNYWHKIGGWPGLPEPLQKLDREAWYCDLIIDSFEEEGAYVQFEWGRKNLGLEYVDAFKLHSIYKVPEDVTQKTGMLKAFDRLKKEGKVKHLAAAQHVETGPVCVAMIESGHFDHLQPAVGITPTPDMRAMLKLAEENDVGIIAKKCMGAVNRAKREPAFKQTVEKFLGPDGKWGAAVIKGMLSIPGINAVTPRCVNFEHFIDNLSPEGLEQTDAEAKAFEALQEFARVEQCSYCGACTRACPNDIAIPETLRFETYCSVYEQPRAARKLYAALPPGRRPEQCGDCGECERACPQGMAVREKLQRARQALA